MTSISPSGVPGDEHFYRYLMDQQRTATANKAALEASKAALSQVWEQSWLIQFPEAADYRVVIDAAVARTITEVTTISTAGTATLTVKINSTALGGTANSVSTSEQSQAHSSANAVASGDDIVLTFSSVSSCENVSVKISGTMSLSAS